MHVRLYTNSSSLVYGFNYTKFTQFSHEVSMQEGHIVYYCRIIFKTRTHYRYVAVALSGALSR